MSSLDQSHRSDQSGSLWWLVGGQLGASRAEWLAGVVDVHPAGAADAGASVSRSVLAQALGIVLFDDLLARVPSAAAYVEEKVSRAETVHLDHGAVRTVSGVDCGRLPAGQESVTRVLAALGYTHRFTYDLTRLRMTGRSWCHLDLPEAIPQYFVSELHAGLFSAPFQEAAARVLGSSRDPLDPAATARLAELRSRRSLGLEDAAALLPVLVSCFGRQHSVPDLADYQALLAESEEMAWIATEGTVCNHMTDRVADVAAVAEAERAAGRPIKDAVEVSGSGRIRQTAHRAPLVARSFGMGGVGGVGGAEGEREGEGGDGAGGGDGVGGGGQGGRISRDVPGSFFEFITRAPLPDGSGLDLAFDAANAQQIFAMTRGDRASRR
ncbi:MAG: hypothetical protein QOE15_531 [Acidimicrobiaceae bacterium]|nr:hypothetical protein [Acidimicrobiaceae bacterium]